ncbi:TPA: YqjD family protein [Pseudomonas aeruginosa]
MARKNAVKDNLEQIQHQSYSELQELLSEANSMLADSAAFAGDKADSAAFAGDKADSARARIGALLEKANDALGKGGSAVAERSRHAVDATESYIGANPWQTVAITTAVGLLAGFLLGRRS